MNNYLHQESHRGGGAGQRDCQGPGWWVCVLPFIRGVSGRTTLSLLIMY